MDVEKVMYILMVQDMDRSIDFYTNVMGFTTRSQSPNWSELAFGDFTLAIHGGGHGEGKSTGLAFTVADIESACREVEAGGGAVVKAPFAGDIPGLTQAVVADTEGNRLELGQYSH